MQGSQGLPQEPTLPTCPQMLVPLLLQYLETLSGLVDSNLNCGPVLTWMEVGLGGSLELGLRGGWPRCENQPASVHEHGEEQSRTGGGLVF